MPHRFIHDGPLAGGRLTIWHEPRVDKPAALGLDFAYGLEGGDYDAGVMLDITGEQVLTLHGHWGESFADILWPVLQWYQPFVVGERQVGLPTLRNLYDRGYGWLYFNRDESRRGRPVRDMIGHHAHAGDSIIPRLRGLIAPRGNDGELLAPRLTVHDAELHAQLCRFGFQPRSSTVTLEGARDSRLKMGAPAGEHDDLVMACAYAAAGIEWLPTYEKPRERLPANSIGGMLGWDEEEEAAKSRWAG